MDPEVNKILKCSLLCLLSVRHGWSGCSLFKPLIKLMVHLKSMEGPLDFRVKLEQCCKSRVLVQKNEGNLHTNCKTPKKKKSKKKKKNKAKKNLQSIFFKQNSQYQISFPVTSPKTLSARKCTVLQLYQPKWITKFSFSKFAKGDRDSGWYCY